MFAMRNIHKGGRTRLILLVAGFFISVTQIYGSVPPREVLMNSQPLWCYAEGKAEPLFYSAQQTNICKMRNTENTCLKGNDSTQQATPHSAKTVNYTEIVKHELLLQNEIPNFLNSLELMFMDFVTSEFDYDAELRRTVANDYSVLKTFLTEVDNLTNPLKS